jgi:hypothetical protein
MFGEQDLGLTSPPIIGMRDSERTLEWHTERLKAKVSIGRSLRNSNFIHAAIAESDTLGIQLAAIAATPEDVDRYLAEMERQAEAAQTPLHVGNLVSLTKVLGGHG